MGDVFSQRIPTLKSCPHFLRGRLRFSFSFLCVNGIGPEKLGLLAETRAWKLFGLIPMMLLHRPRGSRSVGRDELCKRADEVARGHWMELIMSARNGHRTPSLPGVERTDEGERTRRGVVAQERVMQGQRCQSQVQPIPLDVMDFTPETPVELDSRVFATSLRSAPRGSAAGPGGCTYEMLQVCLDDVEVLQMLTSAAEKFSIAALPRVVSKLSSKHNMTALLKRDGGVRGIATGTSFRMLVAKSLARQFSKEVERACVQFQFALSTRAGTDCVGHVT